jgi:hypothetical protein
VLLVLCLIFTSAEWQSISSMPTLFHFSVGWL